MSGQVLNQNDYIEKLYEYGSRFQELYFAKQYAQAKYLYDTALRVAAFLEVPDKVKQELFGYKEDNILDEDGEEELFPSDMVSRCYEICTISLYQGYEHESYRRYGQPPQYFPQPRFPVEGRPKPDPSGQRIAKMLLEKGSG